MYKIENPLFKEIRYRLDHNKDVLIIVVGERRSGKSLASLTLCENLDPSFTAANLKDRVFFRVSDLLKAIDEQRVPDGVCICLQEAGVAMARRDWHKATNKAFSSVLQTFAHRRLCLIMTLPSMSMLDSHAQHLATFILESKGVNYKKQRSNWKVIRVEHNPTFGKTYLPLYKFLERGRVTPTMMSNLALGLPSKDVHEAYELMDLGFKKKLLADSLLNVKRETTSLSEAMDFVKPKLGEIVHKGKVSMAVLLGMGFQRAMAQQIKYEIEKEKGEIKDV